MILKIIVTIVFVLVGLMTLRLVSGDSGTKIAKRDRRALAKRRQGSEAMIRCDTCGKWHAPTEPCTCSSS
jgi:ribosomal protein L32